uniref:Dynein light chain n=1 Tax=Accipiter nisus TaxID=211598 RepID=A0A8B9MY72_9AVES
VSERAVIKNADMSEETQQDAVECAILAIGEYNKSKGEFEKKCSPTWHCIVGRKFGSYVSHETKHFTLFLMLGGNIILVKAG